MPGCSLSFSMCERKSLRSLPLRRCSSIIPWTKAYNSSRAWVKRRMPGSGSFSRKCENGRKESQIAELSASVSSRLTRAESAATSESNSVLPTTHCVRSSISWKSFTSAPSCQGAACRSVKATMSGACWAMRSRRNSGCSAAPLPQMKLAFAAEQALTEDAQMMRVGLGEVVIVRDQNVLDQVRMVEQDETTPSRFDGGNVTIRVGHRHQRPDRIADEIADPSERHKGMRPRRIVGLTHDSSPRFRLPPDVG